MALETHHARLKAALILGGILAAVHSLLAIAMFVYVYSQRGVAQAELAWAVFFLIDLPTAPLTFEWLGSTAPMRAVFDKGYDLVGSGPNLRMFVMVAIAGGLQWFLIGSVFGVCFAWVPGRRRATASRDDNGERLR